MLPSAVEQAGAKLGPIRPEIGNGLLRSVWDTSQASQVLTHFDERELWLYGEYYLQLVNTRDFFLREAEDWGVLDTLAGDPARLRPADLANLRIAIQRARFENRTVALIAGEELDVARRLGLPIPKVNKEWLAETCKPLA